jgi:hypothetical protein
MLRGRGPDRRAFATGEQAWSFGPTIWLCTPQVETHPPSVPSLALAGRVSGMSAPEQDRVSVRVDPRRSRGTGARHQQEGTA